MHRHPHDESTAYGFEHTHSGFGVQTMARTDNPAATAIASACGYAIAVAGFAAVINVLHLGPSLDMLQVYDRVLPNGSVATLAVMRPDDWRIRVRAQSVRPERADFWIRCG